MEKESASTETSMKWYVLLSLTAAMFVYLALGGVTFHYLEGAEETDHKNLLKNFTKHFLDEYPCLTEEDIRKMFMTYLEAYDRGIIELANTSSAPNWDMASAVFFSITVVTTIGYGHIYPVTVGGRAFCVVYAIIGIPLCLSFLAGIGQKLNKLFRVVDKLLHAFKKMPPRTTTILRVLIVIVVGLSCFILVPALMFVFVDGWTYAEAMYYCAITLTTIGFGDLVPGITEQNQRSVYRIMVGVWIFVGLAWVAGVIAVMQDLFTGAVEKSIHKIKDQQTCKNAEDPSNGDDVTTYPPDAQSAENMALQINNNSSGDIPAKCDETDRPPDEQELTAF